MATTGAVGGSTDRCAGPRVPARRGGARPAGRADRACSGPGYDADLGARAVDGSLSTFRSALSSLKTVDVFSTRLATSSPDGPAARDSEAQGRSGSSHGLSAEGLPRSVHPPPQAALAVAGHLRLPVAEIYLRDCIAEPVRLFGRIASITPDGRVKVRFVAPGSTSPICWRSSRSASTAARSPECGSRRREPALAPAPSAVNRRGTHRTGDCLFTSPSVR